MGRLIGMELRKIVEKRVALIGILMVFLLNCMMYDGWMRNWEVMRSDGTYAYGQEADRLDIEAARRYEGPITEEKIRQILKEYELPEDYPESEIPPGYIIRNSTHTSLMEFHDEEGKYNGRTLEEVYGPAAGTVWMGYSKNWSNLLYFLSYVMALGIGYLVIVSVTPVFSDEYGRGMDALILTSRYGKTKAAWAKVSAAFLYSLLVTGAFIGGNIGLMMLRFGITGWDTGIQFNPVGIFMEVPYEMHFGRACVYAVIIWLAAAFFLTGMSLLVSSCCRSGFVALIILALVYSVPMTLTAVMETGRMLLSLTVTHQMTLQTPFMVPGREALGMQIPFQALIVVFDLAAGCICMVMAKRAFSGHQVKE